MSTDLEDRLRTMYAAVAATTEIDDALVEVGPTLVALTTPPPPTTIRRARTVALVAAAAAVFAGLVLVVSTRHDGQPTASLKDRPFAVPTYMAPGYAFIDASLAADVALPGFADTPSQAASLRYRGFRDQDITVVSALAGGRILKGSLEVELAGGVIAELTDAGTRNRRTLAWMQPGGNRVSIVADGITTEELVRIANSVWWVTGPMFGRLTAKSGFVDGTYDGWTPPGDDPSVRLTMTGSLQTHLLVGYGSIFFDVATSTQVGGCGAQGLFRQLSDTTVILRSFSPVDGFRLHLSDRVVDVAAGVHPGLPNARFATLRVPDQALLRSVLPVDCIGGQP